MVLYLQYDGLVKVGVLDEVGGLTVEGWGGGTVQNSIKGFGMKNNFFFYGNGEACWILV